MVTPSYMLAIVDEMERQGVDPRATLAAGRHLRRRAVDRADARGDRGARSTSHAVDIYGLSEVMGPGVAQECVETKDGLHVWEDHFYPEIIDPVTGEVLPDGEEGELVFTSLTKEAHAGHPLPHPRPDPAAARHRAPACAGWRRSPAAPTT